MWIKKLWKKIVCYFVGHDVAISYDMKSLYKTKSNKHKNKGRALTYDIIKTAKCSYCDKKISSDKIRTGLNYHQMRNELKQLSGYDVYTNKYDEDTDVML